MNSRIFCFNSILDDTNSQLIINYENPRYKTNPCCSNIVHLVEWWKKISRDQSIQPPQKKVSISQINSSLNVRNHLVVFEIYTGEKRLKHFLENKTALLGVEPSTLWWLQLLQIHSKSHALLIELARQNLSKFNELTYSSQV